MRAWPREKIRARRALALVGAGAAALAGLLDVIPWGAVAVATAVAAGLYALSTRRFRRRRRLLSTPFPPDRRQLLARRVAYYRRLDEAGRARFEADVRIFLAEQRIYGAGGAALADDTPLLIAASAAILSHGLPDWEWPTVRDIVVHPGAFDEEYRAGERADIAGMVHRQGPVLYSAKDLRRGFRRADGSNVGLHELAHIMDLADGYADGVPIGAEWVAEAPWQEVVHERLAALRRRKYGELRDYAGTNEAEFFAVAVEAFFERPERLHSRDPQLYRLLADYFRQDPAGAADERGATAP